MDAELDAVVVGGGPAGLSAATWLGRYRRRTLLIDAGDHRNRMVERAHGYLTRDPVPPREILATAARDLDRYGCVGRLDGEVVAVRGECGAFDVETAGGEVHRALRVVLCTGVVDALPEVEGFDLHYGASMFHCPSCDGYEARERDVVVLGWAPHVAGFSLELLDWARSVTIVTEGFDFQGDDRHWRALADHGITVVEKDAVALVGERGDLRTVRLDDGTEIPAQMAFFSIGHDPRRTLADALGCAVDEEGYVAVDEHGGTSVAGVFAAGDLVPGYQLIQVAAAKGTTAGVGCAMSLRRDPPLEGRPERAPDVEEALGDPAG
jgi:thioredoxin reductase